MRSRLHPAALSTLALTLLFALALSTLPAGAEDAAAPAATAPFPHHWTVLIQGHEAGEMTRKEAADGEEVWTFTFNDRGRGPELTTTIRYGAGRSPSPVDDHRPRLLEGARGGDLHPGWRPGFRLGRPAGRRPTARAARPSPVRPTT